MNLAPESDESEEESDEFGEDFNFTAENPGRIPTNLLRIISEITSFTVLRILSGIPSGFSSDSIQVLL